MAKFLGRMTGSQIKDKDSAQQQLKNWSPQYDYLVCFDVDGHLLDNMTAKQILVFHPHFMDVFGLRSIETYYRLHAEYHNLWGKDRGCDRYVAILYILGSLLEDRELKRSLSQELEQEMRKIKVSLEGYLAYIESTGGAFGFDSLLKYQRDNRDDTNLTFLLIWSKAVDMTFPFVTVPMQPFPGVRETLEFVAQRSDVLIVSKTPYEDICNWLEHHDLLSFVTAVAGKEQGGKDEHICFASGGTFDAKQKAVTTKGQAYPPAHVIMGGDGGGDLKAAKANDAYFFPTPPGKEEEAWERAIDDVFTPFFNDSYGKLETRRIEAFQAAMVPRGTWEESNYNHSEAYLVLQPKRIQLYQQLKAGGKLALL